MSSTTTSVAADNKKRDHDEMASASTIFAVPVTTGDEYTEEERQDISRKLARTLGPSETRIKNHQAYLEGFLAWDLANDTFGYDGWSCSIRGFSKFHVSRSRLF
jgi:hypothetical protein